MPLTTLQEFINGPLSATDALKLRDEGDYGFKTILVTDSMSLFAAVSATKIKQPTEKGLHVHLFWIRELLDKNITTNLRWCATRDMTADAHTKAFIDRERSWTSWQGGSYTVRPKRQVRASPICAHRQGRTSCSRQRCTRQRSGCDLAPPHLADK